MYQHVSNGVTSLLCLSHVMMYILNEFKPHLTPSPKHPPFRVYCSSSSALTYFDVTVANLTYVLWRFWWLLECCVYVLAAYDELVGDSFILADCVDIRIYASIHLANNVNGLAKDIYVKARGVILWLRHKVGGRSTADQYLTSRFTSWHPSATCSHRWLHGWCPSSEQRRYVARRVN